MNRKKVIFISVLVNAGLLLVLFISAVFFREDTSTVNLEPQDQSKNLAQDAKKYFAEPYATNTSGLENVAAVTPATTSETAQTPALSPDSQSAAQPVAEASPSDVAVVHTLPQVAETAAVEEKVVSAPETQTPVVQAAPEEAKDNFVAVKVKRGDTLEKIAKAHKTSISKIKKINHLQTHFLRVGQRLLVPNKKMGATCSVQKHVSSPGASSSSEFYTVKCGDNPWTIAMKHNMKVEELLHLNHLTKEKARHLRAGDQLRVR
jgi:LysM repeat protein